MKKNRTVEVKESTSVNEVNELLQNEEWLLREIVTIHEKITYVLVRREEMQL